MHEDIAGYRDMSEIPKKPNIYICGSINTYQCGICKTHISNRQSYNYCRICGVKIDWSEIESN